MAVPSNFSRKYFFKIYILQHALSLMDCVLNDLSNDKLYCRFVGAGGRGGAAGFFHVLNHIKNAGQEDHA